MNNKLHDDDGKFKKGHPKIGGIGKGDKHSEETKGKIRNLRIGKTWDEIFGEEKAEPPYGKALHEGEIRR